MSGHHTRFGLVAVKFRSRYGYHLWVSVRNAGLGLLVDV